MVGTVLVEVGSVQDSPGALFPNICRDVTELVDEGLVVDLLHESLPCLASDEQVVREHSLWFSLLRHHQQRDCTSSPVQLRYLVCHESEYRNTRFQLVTGSMTRK